MKNFTIRQLELFVAMVNQGSILGASAHTGVSRAVIAEAVDNLEKLSGVKLVLRRRAKGVELTSEGVEMFDYALSLLNSADIFEEQATRRPLSGTLRVGCFTSLAPTMLPRITKLYYEIYPEVELEYVTGDRETLTNALRRGDIEVACMYQWGLDDSLGSKLLYATRLHVLLPEDHDLAGRDVVPLQALSRENLILLETSPSSVDILSYFQAHNVQPHIWRRATDFELVRSLVARGLGYSMFLQRPRNVKSYEGRVIETRRLSPLPPSRYAAILWPAGRMLSHRAQVFVDLCVDHVSEIAPPALYEEDGLL